jgi:hypothetical protein
MIFVELGDRRFEDEGKSMILDKGNKSTPSSMRATNNKGPTEIALDHARRSDKSFSWNPSEHPRRISWKGPTSQCRIAGRRSNFEDFSSESNRFCVGGS